MTLSFGTLTLRFRQGYHRRNRLAKHEGPSLWFDALDAPAKRGRTRRISCRICGPPRLFPSPQWPLQYKSATISGGEAGVHATTATRGGIRHRGGQAGALRGPFALGGGAQYRDRALRLWPAGRS